MKVDYTDATVRAHVYDLLDTSFPRISERIHIAAHFGALWHELSTAFVKFVDGIAVAHAGVLAIPLVVNGEESTVAGIHAVCTRPEFRGQGHAQAVLDEALSFADARFGTAILTTSIPSMYEPFGFRVVPEVVMKYRGPRPARPGRPARRLNATDSEDLELLQDLLSRRTPVSYVMSSVDSGGLLITNEVLASWEIRRLYYSEDLDIALVLDAAGGTLKVLDVVGPEIPEVEALLASVPLPFEQVEFHFMPDRLGGGPYQSKPADPSDLLMVRGRLALPQELRLPPLARC